MWLGSFRCNCTSGQLKKRGGGGELHEKKKKAKSKQNGNRQRNNMRKRKQTSFEVTRTWDSFTTWKVISIMYLYWNVF